MKKLNSRSDLTPMIEKIIDNARDQIQILADEYRETVMIPICRKLRLTYLAGNGNFAFYPIDDVSVNSSISNRFDAEHYAYGKYKALVPIFKQLEIEITHNDLFGYYVLDIRWPVAQG